MTVNGALRLHVCMETGVRTGGKQIRRVRSKWVRRLCADEPYSLTSPAEVMKMLAGSAAMARYKRRPSD